MSENQQKIVIAALIGAVIILIAIFLWFIFRPKDKPTNLTQTATSTVQTGAGAVEPIILERASEIRLQNENNFPLAAKQVAIIFSERYASYSTDEPVKNVQDLKTLVTDSFYIELMKEAESREFGSVFSGYSAKALAANLTNSEQLEVKASIDLQIEQTLGEGERNNVIYRTLNVVLLKTGEEWKVTSASWQ